MSEQMLRKGVDFVGITLSFFCHDGKGNFVMTKRGANCRDEQGKWDFGGGGLELHDSVEERLRQEIKEEFCADVITSEFMGYRDIHRENEFGTTHWVSLNFKVLVDPTQVKNGEPHKFDEVRWYTLDALPSPLHSQVPFELEKFGDKLFSRA